MPSSIQKPPPSCRVRMKSDSTVSAASATGVAQRDEIAPSQRSTAAAVNSATARTGRSPKPVDRTSHTQRVDEKRARDAWASCVRFVAGFDPRERDPHTTLLTLAERAPAMADTDRYGGGTL